MKNNTLKKLLSVLLALAMLLTSFGAAALAEGETPDPSLYKTFIVELKDSYGDGWNGSALIVQLRDAEEAAYTITLEDGNAATFEMTLTAGEAYDLIWQEGSYAYEASFVIIEKETGGLVQDVDNCGDYHDGDTIFSLTPHAHTWSYDTTMGFDDDDHYEEFIRARCADDCYLLEWPDLRVSGPDNSADFVYDGTPKPAVLYTTLRPELFPETGYSTDAFPGAEVNYTKNDEAFEGVPVEQGHYLARATVDLESVSAKYAIHGWIYNGDGTHSMRCDVCGRNETAACDFTLTATENGVKKFTCPLCGGAKYETFSTQTVTWDFEDDPAGSWTFVDADNDGNNWAWSGSSAVYQYFSEGAEVEFLGRDESRCIMSGSYSNVYGELWPENWAVSPAVSTECVASAAVSFYACAQDYSYPREHFRVYAAHSADPAALAESPISDEEVLAATRSQGAWLLYEYEIPAALLNGEPLYLAIRHFNVTNQFLIDIDDVSYTANMRDCDPHTPVLVQPDAVSCHAPYYRCANCGRSFRDAECESPVLLSEISFADGHALTAAADGGTLNVSCANGVCGLNAALTLNAPAKAADYNAGNALASLTGLDAFNAALGLSVSTDDIVYYSGDTLLAAAPTAMGDYTAALTVTVGGADYTIRVAYFIGDRAALAVMAAIDAIGEVAYSDACKDKIDAARNAYNALTDAQKALVANYVVLTDAEDMYATLKGLHDWDAANNAVQLIDDIGEVAYTQECFMKIKSARYSYDNLTEDQKALVSNYGVLIDAEAAYQLAADKAAFDAYKFNLIATVQAMAQAGDSAAAQQIIADAASGIALLAYDETKSLAENEAALDALADIADALAAQRAADAAAAADRAAAAAVDALIDAVGEVEYTDACKEKIDAARAAYEALTPAQQALVEKSGALTAAEEEYARLKAEAEQPGEEEPATPAEGAGVCQLCGETHDITKPAGFIIDYIHDVLFIIKRLVSFFTYGLYVE